ncbi:VOC family protein [Gryllotalpicola ginsengisoli]|uniref:VOC family protein n=1 Tax=Gryllotalpicola ginsengisoli TaxID=444608 RepID=UPI0003B44ABF|nr:VOC family protein [Gryllotalpicola ginsengisoli]
MQGFEKPIGTTLQLQVGDLGRARALYDALIGAEPEFQPHEDFVEYRLQGEVWLQLVVVDEVRPLTNRMRFGVTDARAMHRAAAEAGLTPGPLESLPGVVRYFNFDDPWGNHLGYYEELAAPADASVPGGSVHDDALFVVDDEG